MGSVSDIRALLSFFEDKVPDKESNRHVQNYANDSSSWCRANELFESIHTRRLEAARIGDKDKDSQYGFEEVCAKTLYNITGPATPYDPDSPYWIIKNALILAKVSAISIEDVVNIVAPDKP